MFRHTMLAKQYFNEFSINTSLHGLKYITEEGRHWVERLMWVLSCGACIFSATLLIQKIWAQYSTSPTITSIESTHYPIWEVPFPAVTVCNVNKVHLSQAMHFYYSEKLDQELEEQEYFGFIQQLAEIIQPEEVEKSRYNISLINEILKKRNLNMETIMMKLTQPCSSMMAKCKWRGEVTPCEKLFTMQKSDAGFCCSFNYIPPERSKTQKVPLRVNGAGYLSGLSVLLDPRLEDYYAALFSFYGLQVLVHSPRDYPEISASGIILPPLKSSFLQVSAAITYSTPNVRSLSPEQRQCVFADEKTLILNGDSSRYTFANCLMKCKLEYMEKYCNCTPYFYPDDDRPRQCRLKDVECMAQYRRLFNNLQPPNPVPGLADNDEAMSCSCQPTCTDITYTSVLSQGDLFSSEYDRTHFFKEIGITNHSILHVYFKDLSVMKLRRDVIYSWNDMLASFGGIVGLCLGSSLLSLVEIVYFFLVRPYFNWRRGVEVTPVNTQHIRSPAFHLQPRSQHQSRPSQVMHVNPPDISLRTREMYPVKLYPPYDWLN